ncbi:hypothetical protein F444_20441 [Phytophthora nicotianae P1976]|uniref:Uncharacterized protein n=2 Tax=Phytophthora nicotianae TaxID=4792 RepID=A0A080Z4H4_PHYNI|nr:hypothetical protein F444_20441 [Phytophthora nicotianae P1976]
MVNAFQAGCSSIKGRGASTKKQTCFIEGPGRVGEDDRGHKTAVPSLRMTLAMVLAALHLQPGRTKSTFYPY